MLVVTEVRMLLLLLFRLDKKIVYTLQFIGKLNFPPIPKQNKSGKPF